jgi:hypothetical protein
MAILVLGLLVVGWDLLSSLLRPPRPLSNPWGATTAEWLTDAASTEDGSPRPLAVYDFAAYRFDPESRTYVVGPGTGGE